MASFLHTRRVPFTETLTISDATMTVITLPPEAYLYILGDSNSMKLVESKADGTAIVLDDDGEAVPSSGVLTYTSQEVKQGPPPIQLGRRVGKINGKWYTTIALAKVSGDVEVRLRVESAPGEHAQ